MSKVYIAGKITGDWQYREKFERAAELLRREGHVVLNPAVLPEGTFASARSAGCSEQKGVAAVAERKQNIFAKRDAVTATGKSCKETVLRICFSMIDVADRVVLLPDWSESPGARLEKEYCRSRESRSDCSHGEIALQSSRYIGKGMVEL